MSKPVQQPATVVEPDTRRRNFLIGAGVGTVGAAAALVAASTATPQASTEKPVEAASGDSGYRESEHVRRYYSTTRI